MVNVCKRALKKTSASSKAEGIIILLLTQGLHRNIGWLDDWNVVILKPQLQEMLQIFIADTVPFCSVQKFFIGPKVAVLYRNKYIHH